MQFVATSSVKNDGFISFWKERVSPSTLIAQYNSSTNTLVVLKDCTGYGCYAAVNIPYVRSKAHLDVFRDIEELGFMKPIELPYRKYRYIEVTRDEIDCGYAVAWSLAEYSPCAGCIYQTGESALPCAVNPSLFGAGCREYSN